MFKLPNLHTMAKRKKTLMFEGCYGVFYEHSTAYLNSKHNGSFLEHRTKHLFLKQKISIHKEETFFFRT